MTGIYKYLIIKPLKLVVQFHQNDLTFNGIKKLKQSIIDDPEYNSNYNFIIDLRLANIKMDQNELHLYGDWVESILNDEKKHLSLLTLNSRQVISALLFKLNDNFKNLHYDVFSTMEGALTHVDVDISNMPFVESEIDKLKVEV
tara:strand:+ start:4163 stop:4594 length:432 start_codon:yes stop_codon:yes gene_type:complete